MCKLSLSIIFVVLFLVGRVEATSLNLSNPSFETPGDVPSGLGLVTLNEWRGDPASSVTAENGVTPAEGNRMILFHESFPGGPAGYDCAIWQCLDVRSYHPYIQAGGTILTGTALFNRIVGDIQTDTEFGVGLKAYGSMPSSFHDEIANVYVPIFSDSNQNTWESGSANLLLPPNTQFISIYILALENVHDDSSFPEFDGHYADSVTLNLAPVPEPSVFVLLGMSAIGLLLLGDGGSRLRKNTAPVA